MVIKKKTASAHRQIILNEADDDVSADQDPSASNTGTAVHCDGPLVVHGPQIADETDQLLGAVRHAMVRPVCELQVVDVMSVARLWRGQFKTGAPAVTFTKFRYEIIWILYLKLLRDTIDSIFFFFYKNRYKTTSKLSIFDKAAAMHPCSIHANFFTDIYFPLPGLPFTSWF